MPLSTSLSSSIVPSASAAEPGPDWPVAKQLWGIAWQFHWVGFGVLFSILAVRSSLALVHVKTRQGFGRKPLFIAINILLVMLGVTRAFYLFLDPYSSGDNGVKNPDWLARLIFGIAFPCLTSSFCLVHLAFVEVAKIKIGSKKLRSVRFLSGVITIHFVLVMSTETVTAIKPNFAPLLIVCQSFFIVWGFLLSGSFIYSGMKVIRHTRSVEKELESIEFGEVTSKARSEKLSRARTSKVAKVTFVTSILGFACCGLQMYSMFGVYGFYSKVVKPSPWPWWVFQTCFRLVECCMACTIAYIVTH